MALEYHIPGGALQHMTMINVPIFAASSPASFRDFIVAAKPDPKTGQPDPQKLKAYLAAHPDAMALNELASHHNPTANYYQTTYFSVHTFKFIDKKGTEHLVKWRFVPRDGTKEMTPTEMKSAPHQGAGGVGHDRLCRRARRPAGQSDVGMARNPQAFHGGHAHHYQGERAGEGRGL
jgi:hypothetical protein